MNPELIALYLICRRTGAKAQRAIQQARWWLAAGLSADCISLIND